MRQLDHIGDEADARRFSAFLQAEGIEHRIEPAGGDGGWVLWVLDDDDLSGARDWLARYRANPHDAPFEKAASEAVEKAARARRALEALRRQGKPHRTAGGGPAILRTPVTAILVILALAVTALTEFGSNPSIQTFVITTYERVGDTIRFSTTLPEIRGGQIWRLFTPLFLHFHPLHLIFNVWWMLDLGSAVERAAGRRTLIGLTVVIAILSHLAQFHVSGPAFGGLSGLVYGLLGYAWVRGKHDLTSGLFVPPQVAAIMGGWFLLGLTGMIGNVANIVHGVGLIVGMVAGYVAAMRAAR